MIVSEPESVPSTVEAFGEALEEVQIDGQTARVNTIHSNHVAPPGLPVVFRCGSTAIPKACCPLGVAVKPVYRDFETGTVFPIVLQRLRWQFAKALRQGIAKFTGIDSGSKHVHYDSLGPSALVKAVRIIDQELCEIAEAFDFLLQVTPTNSAQAWQEFSEKGYKTTPVLHYRPLPYHPSLLKRGYSMSKSSALKIRRWLISFGRSKLNSISSCLLSETWILHIFWQTLCNYMVRRMMN